MSGEAGGWFGDVENNPRGRALQMLFVAFSTVPLALTYVDTFSVPAGMAGVAVGVGAVCGAGVSLLGEHLDEPLLSGYSEIVALIAIGAATVALWWILSSEGIRTFALGSVAFVWTGALCDVARYLLLPRLAADRD
ncbi:hypothetical protein [Halomicrobium salinisoli]|uniref:hypothetical protein n=1 Tax=Halomicrobium salinisoli TaxID=2878391 RepID=UPI001CEFCDEA|nr:hypothetical protein [Halomicrobium salinisoli]